MQLRRRSTKTHASFFLSIEKQNRGVEKNCHGFCSLPSPCTPPRVCLWPLGFLRIKQYAMPGPHPAGLLHKSAAYRPQKNRRSMIFYGPCFFVAFAAVRHLLSPCRPWPIILPSATLQANTKVPAAFAPPSLRPPQKA